MTLSLTETKMSKIIAIVENLRKLSQKTNWKVRDHIFKQKCNLAFVIPVITEFILKPFTFCNFSQSTEEMKIL